MTSGALKYEALVFEIHDHVVPNWFMVGYSGAIREFTRVHIFFNPRPLPRFGYNDANYFSRAGATVMRYCSTLLPQLAASGGIK